MPNYNNSKIYKLVCNDPNIIYIGSTTQKLCQRLSKHKRTKIHNEKISSQKLFEIGEVKIILIEEVNCENKEQLLKRERHYIELLDCVNKNIPGRTNKEYYDDNKKILLQKNKIHREKNKEHYKKYYLDNKEHKLKQFKEYRTTHQTEIKQQNKDYYLKNTKKLKKKSNDYRLKNKDVKLSCKVCKMEMKKDSFSRHCKTKKHLGNLN